jgi:hypothetical protein
MTKKKKIMLILAVIVGVLIGLNFILEKQIHIKKELEISQNVEVVWEIMGKQFAQVDQWSTNFKTSKPGGSSTFAGLEYSERITLTNRGETIQVLDSFDSTKHKLTYHITKGKPGIAKQASAVWSLNTIDANKSTVILEFDMTTKGLLGFLMTPLIKKGIGKSASEIAEDLKYYVENGEPHPRKVEAIKNQNN